LGNRGGGLGSVGGKDPGAGAWTALEPILAAAREEVARRRERMPVAELERAAGERADRRCFLDALRRPGLSLIAEHKRRSPSAGTIREGGALAGVVRAYQRGGAAGPSVPTPGAPLRGAPPRPP